MRVMIREIQERLSCGESRKPPVDMVSPHPDAHETMGTERRRVLIVEDEFFIAAEAEAILSDAGYEVVGIARDSATALSLASNEKPDVILMDIRLASGLDGVETARLIYQQLGIRSLFISAHADERTKQRAQDVRPCGWLHKPYTDDQLLAVVSSVFSELES